MTEGSDFPPATLEVVCVALGLNDDPGSSPALHTLLARNEQSPQDAAWSLPRGRVRAEESLEDAVRRQFGRAGMAVRTLEQLRTTCADVGGQRIVTIAYYGLVHFQERSTTASIGEFSVDALPQLEPFYDDVVARAIHRVREHVRWTLTRVGGVVHTQGEDSGKLLSREAAGVFDFLPPRFSLTHLQRLCEAIEGTSLDKRNFRKKVLATGLLVETDEVEHGVRHRAAKLYRFDRRKYDRLVKPRCAVLG